MLLVAWCAWHPTYWGRRKLLRLRLVPGLLWRRHRLWLVSHGICRRCASRWRA